MSRTALVVGFTIVLVVLAAVPTAYGLRWSYCKHYGTNLGWWCRGHHHFPEFDWEQVPLDARQKFERFCRIIAARHPPEQDSWNDLSAEERNRTQHRVWTATPDRVSTFVGEIDDAVAGTHAHAVGMFGTSFYYHASAISENGDWKVEHWYSSQTRLNFTKLENSQESELIGIFDGPEAPKKIDLTRFEGGGEFYWGSKYKFGDFTYSFYVELPDRNDALHRHYTNAHDFIAAGLRSLDRLEAALVEYLNSDGPTSISTKLVDQVDIIKCTCEEVDGPANRALTADEKSIVLADMTAELEHRRTLLKAHGDVWFETLQKIRIEVE